MNGFICFAKNLTQRDFYRSLNIFFFLNLKWKKKQAEE
jgi:hypothetical protein